MGDVKMTFKLEALRHRPGMFNAKQRRQWRRAARRVSKKDFEAFCYYTDPRSVKVPPK